LEYGESPVALCARTRYRYVVRDASPLPVKAVAVPATTATWAKFVQLDPRQRSILTSVWLVVVFVHVSPIALLERAVAVRFVGALGRVDAFTTMDVDVVFVAPPLSVTVKVGT
jgi:hypothetical protein